MSEATAPVEAIVEPHVRLSDSQIKVLQALVVFMEAAGSQLAPVYSVGISGLPRVDVSGPFGTVKVNHE